MECHLPHHLGGGNQKTLTKLGPVTLFETISEFQEHCTSRQSVFKKLQRFCFRQRVQLPGETFVSFASALWELALGCDFGSLQNELVLHQLIQKAKDWRIREALFSQIDYLTLARAVELGSQMEAAFKAVPNRMSPGIAQWERQITCNRNWIKKGYQAYGSLNQRKEKLISVPENKCRLSRTQNHTFQHYHKKRFSPSPGVMPPEPVENCTSEGAPDEDQTSLVPSTLELEIRGSGQETDEDYFETQSHQSESLSDIKTEPYESVSDSESIASDLTREPSLSSHCFSSEMEEPWLNFFEPKVLSRPLCTRSLEYMQKEAVELHTVLQGSHNKGELEMRTEVLRTEEANGKERMLTYNVPYIGLETTKEDSVLKTEATLVAETRYVGKQMSLQVSSKHLAEDGVARNNTGIAVKELASVRSNSESSLTFLETQCTPVHTETVSRLSLPNVYLETDRTWKRNCEAFGVSYKDYTPSSQCSRKSIVDTKQTTVPHLCGRNLKTTGLPGLKSKFHVPLQRPRNLEVKSWHSTPENISANANDCICPKHKLSWSCSRLHLAVSDYECVCENLRRFDDCSRKFLKMEKDTGIEGLLLNTHLDSNKNLLTHVANTYQVSSTNLRNEFKTCGFTTKGADVFPESKSVAPSQQSEHVSGQEITLECIPTNLNANVILRTNQYKLEGGRGIHEIPQELSSNFENHNGEFQGNYLGVQIMDNCDNSSDTHASTVSKRLDIERNCLESPNNETFVGVNELRRDWGSLDGVLTSCKRAFTAHQRKGVFQNMSRKSGAFKCPISGQEGLDDYFVCVERENCYSRDGKDVSGLELASRSHYIGHEGNSEQVSALKSVSVQSPGQKGIQIKNMGSEKYLAGLTTEIMQHENLASPLIPLKDDQELQKASKAQSSYGEDSLLACVIPGGRDGFLVNQESAKSTNEEGETTYLASPPLFDCAHSTGTTVENDSLQNNLSLESTTENQSDEGNADSFARDDKMEACQRNADSDFETAQDSLQFETRVHMVGDEVMATNVEQDLCVTMARRQVMNSISGLCTEVTDTGETLGNDMPGKRIFVKEDTKTCDVVMKTCDEKINHCGNFSRTELNRSFSLGDSRCISTNHEQKLNMDVHDASEKIDNQNIISKTSLDNISTGSTNSEEMDENMCNFQGSNSSFYKAVQKNSKARITEKSLKHSKFLGFSKMASFRKSKIVTTENQGSTQNKTEELGGEEEGEVDESMKPLPNSLSCSTFQSRDNCLAEYSDDDDLFYERSAGPFNRISLRKASSSGRTLLEDVSPNPTPEMARPKYCEGKVLTSVENKDSESTEYPELRKSSSENDFKRNKNTESKNFRTRLALAHRSLSSFFESKSLEKENAEQCPKILMKNEKEKAKLYQTSWKAFLKSKEADGLKRSAYSSLPTQQSPSTQRSPGSFSRRSSKEKLEFHSGQVCLSSEVSNGSSTEAGYSDSSGISDFMPVDARRRRKAVSRELSVNCPHSPDYNGKEEAMGNDKDASFEEIWLKSSVSPIDLQSSFSHFTPSCPQLSMYERKDMPCRPMSPKPQSPRTSSRKGFHYPGRLSSTSMISLGNISMNDSNLETPEKPKTLKPRSSFLVSMHSLDNDYQREDSGISSQSQISLNTVSSVSDIIRDEVSRHALVVVGT
uniref:Uncharacterized protein n=1 Tax=Sphaerodactylus townsendi TaxID=933632 RepID=A0ACB8FAA0_9SAUR